MESHTVYNDSPWFCPESIEFISSLLKPDWVIFETGCGSSTIWFSNRVKKVISFEHTELFYKKIKKLIEDKKIENIDLRLNPNYPEEGILGFGKDEFDFVSIDGRGRVKSIKTILSFLKPGGYLLLNNSERIRYEQAVILLDKWENKIFGGINWQTRIWRKP